LHFQPPAEQLCLEAHCVAKKTLVFPITLISPGRSPSLLVRTWNTEFQDQCNFNPACKNYQFKRWLTAHSSVNSKTKKN
jgi:hypothetical protein